MVAVDRAAGELRRNSAVVIDDDRGAVLAQAAETVTAGSLAALSRLSHGNVSLALSTHMKKLQAGCSNTRSGSRSILCRIGVRGGMATWSVDKFESHPSSMLKSVSPGP